MLDNSGHTTQQPILTFIANISGSRREEYESSPHTVASESTHTLAAKHMMFAFIAKHRGIWPVDWLCGVHGVSRGGFYARLTRPLSQRSHSDENLGAKVREIFISSDRTYGARRVWHDMVEGGVSCGLHRIERLTRLQTLKVPPRRSGLTMVGRCEYVRVRAFSRSFSNLSKRHARSPPSTVCLDIFSPPPAQLT